MNSTLARRRALRQDPLVRTEGERQDQVIDRDFVQALPIRGVPHDHASVVSAGSEHRAVWAEGQREHTLEPLRERLTERLPGRGVPPEHPSVIEPARNQRSSIRREGRRGGTSFVRHEPFVHLGPGGRIPQEHPAEPSGRDRSSIRAGRDTQQDAFRIGQVAWDAQGVQVGATGLDRPPRYAPEERGAREPAVVGAHGQAVVVLPVDRFADRDPRARVPDRMSPPPPDEDRAGTLREENGPADNSRLPSLVNATAPTAPPSPTTRAPAFQTMTDPSALAETRSVPVGSTSRHRRRGVAEQRVSDLLPGREVPKANRSVGTRRGETAAVGREGDVEHLNLCVP